MTKELFLSNLPEPEFLQENESPGVKSGELWNLNRSLSRKWKLWRRCLHLETLPLSGKSARFYWWMTNLAAVNKESEFSKTVDSRSILLWQSNRPVLDVGLVRTI